jgi:IS30 family transposase
MGSPDIAKINAECNKIREFLSDGKHRSHKDIRSALNIPPATYSRRIRRIYEQDKDTSAEVAKANVIDRTQRMKSALEKVSTINNEIMSDKKTPARDRIAASHMFLATEIWMYQNDTYGPNNSEMREFININGIPSKVTRPNQSG